MFSIRPVVTSQLVLYRTGHIASHFWAGDYLVQPYELWVQSFLILYVLHIKRDAQRFTQSPELCITGTLVSTIMLKSEGIWIFLYRPNLRCSVSSLFVLPISINLTYIGDIYMRSTVSFYIIVSRLPSIFCYIIHFLWRITDFESWIRYVECWNYIENKLLI